MLKPVAADGEEMNTRNVVPPDPLQVARPGLGARTARASAINLAAGAARYPLSIISVAILARLLSPTNFGVYESVAAFAALLATFSDFGLTAAMVHKENITQDEVSGLFWVSVILGIGLFGILTLSGPILAHFYGDRRQAGFAALLGVSFLITSLRIQHAALCVRQQHFGKIVLADFAGLLASFPVAVITALRGWGPWAFSARDIAGPLVTAAALWIMVPWRPQMAWRWSSIKSLLSFGGHLTLSRWVGNIFMRVDKMVLGLFVAAAVLGQYGRAFFIGTLPCVVLSAAITQPFISMLARVNSDDRARARELYLRFWQFTIAVPMFGGLLLAPFGPDVVRFLYGSHWTLAGNYLRLLSPAAAFFVAYSAAFNLAVVHGRMEALARFAISMIPLYLICYLVGARWGAPGMAVAYSAAMVTAGATATVLSTGWFGINKRQLLESSLTPAVVAVSTAVVAVLLRSVASTFTASFVLGFMASLGITVALYLLLLWRFCPAVIEDLTRSIKMAVHRGT
jgi:PST family polysaccharide transporter